MCEHVVVSENAPEPEESTRDELPIGSPQGQCCHGTRPACLLHGLTCLRQGVARTPRRCHSPPHKLTPGGMNRLPHRQVNAQYCSESIRITLKYLRHTDMVVNRLAAKAAMGTFSRHADAAIGASERLCMCHLLFPWLRRKDRCTESQSRGEDVRMSASTELKHDAPPFLSDARLRLRFAGGSLLVPPENE
jgi:hypothetical protein